MASLQRTMPLLAGFSAVEDAEAAKPLSNEKSAMLDLFQRIIESCHPDDDTRAEVAYAIARHLKLDCPCAYHDPAQQVAVPQGWKLVPISPTREMWSAAGDAVVALQNTGTLHHDKISASVYRAMLAAAPQPPQGEKQ